MQNVKKNILTHIILMNALVIILMAFSGMQKVEADVICSNSPVPAGHVVTQVRQNDSFCTASYLEFTTAPVYEGIYMCSATPIPDGYGATYANRSNNVCTNTYLQYRIQQLRDNIEICSIPRGPTGSASYVPTGYGVTNARRNDNVCTDFHLLVRINQLRDNMNICSVPRGPTATNSPVPEGFVASYIQRPVDNICTNYYSLYTINQVTGSRMQMCDVSPVPNNYIITGTDSINRQCDIFDLHYIEPTSVPVSADFSYSIKQVYNRFFGFLPQLGYYIYANATTTGFPPDSSLTYTWILSTGETKVVEGSTLGFFYTFSQPHTLTLTVTDGTRTTSQVIKTLN